MSTSSAESEPSSIIWDIIRYAIVAVAAGTLIWFYFFNTPINYVNRECTGKTQGTDYIVYVARFPENADWQKVATAIQDRLDALEKNPSVNRELPALKEFPDVAIDLSAVAQGFAVDCVAELLEEQKIADFLIVIGDNVRSKGKKVKGNDWNITDFLIGMDNNKRVKAKDWIVGIEMPTLDFSDGFLGLQQTFPLKDQSLATRQSKQPSELASVTVIAPTCTLANAWASALLTLGEQKGAELAQQHGIVALFLLRKGNDIVEVPSKHWQK